MVFFDEMGLLKRLDTGTRDGTPAQYAARMARLLQLQDAMLRGLRPNVQGYMWLSLYLGDPLCRGSQCGSWNFSASNLVNPDGSLTAVGTMWRSLAAQP